MDGGLGGDAGGISGLLELIREHKAALEYDLIALGLRLAWLGSEALSWRDLLVIVQQSPADCALARALNPDLAWGGLTEYLLAHISDTVSWLQWAKTEDGSKNRNHPKLWPRPGVEVPEKKPVTTVPLDEAIARLGWKKTEGVD